MRSAAALLLLAVAALMPPTAVACQYTVPDALDRVTWLDDSTLVGRTALEQQGRVDLENGTVKSEWPEPAYVSPDKRYVVFARVGPDVQTGETRTADSCGGHFSRHLLAYDLTDAEAEIADPGPIWGVTSTPEGVAVTDGDEIRVLAWGTWDIVRREPTPSNVRYHFTSDFRPPGSSTLPAWTVAVSPEKTFAAVELEDVNTTELRIVRLEDGVVVGRETLDALDREWAWGAQGLAWVEHREAVGSSVLRIWEHPELDGGQRGRVVDPGSAGLAISSGGRIALTFPRDATHAGLQLFDMDLELERSVEIEVTDRSMQPLANAIAAIPVPEYPPEAHEETAADPSPRSVAGPTPPLLLVAAVLAGVLRRGLSRPWRGTSPALRR